jgi:hypothetical protein
MAGTYYENNANHRNILCKCKEFSNIRAGGSLSAGTHTFKD